MRIYHSLGLTIAMLSVGAVAHGQHHSAAPGPVVTPVLTQPLPDYPGKEGHVLTVTYPPGGSSPLHHHDAYAFVYVLEGAVTMAVEGGEEVTLKAGQAWTEKPGDIHAVSRNASKTEPAKFVVFFLKDAGKPAVMPGR
ncbi:MULTISPECIES: cupin domain-containing protein [unclassified Lysobacter]|uniref:cupin domain-containing protein n=1 Tax=unclassified Lysobacter TaxID=2635362 RepID=UPI001C21B5D9|nr:cupin domain-containing protein [Lysobacter sp. MMG2]MBU8977097.1 cupin domain-containing protein [Lysobacter sp. MMG2]